MGLFRADFYRFFALGFAGGALLIVATIGIDGRGPLTDNIVPPAQAQTAR